MEMLMLDLDLFKHFKDKHGHQAGDMALRTVLRCIRPCLFPASYGDSKPAGIDLESEQIPVVLKILNERIDHGRLIQHLRKNQGLRLLFHLLRLFKRSA